MASILTITSFIFNLIKKFYLSKHVHMHKHHKEDMAKLPCAITRAMMPAGERVSLLALAGKVCQAMRHHSMRCA